MLMLQTLLLTCSVHSNRKKNTLSFSNSNTDLSKDVKVTSPTIQISLQGKTPDATQQQQRPWNTSHSTPITVPAIALTNGGQTDFYDVLGLICLKGGLSIDTTFDPCYFSLDTTLYLCLKFNFLCNNFTQLNFFYEKGKDPDP